MYQNPVFKNTLLSRRGLNLQAVFNISELPAEIVEVLALECKSLTDFRQLILLGHGGGTLWESLKQEKFQSENPIDDFTLKLIKTHFSENGAGSCHHILYPGDSGVGLQRLGKLAGWHNSSPFMVGINQTWGSWYAYRAFLLTDTDFPVTTPIQNESPCHRCEHKVCFSHCPGMAVQEEGFSLQKCIDYRKQDSSQCKTQCLARSSCPVAAEQRYTDEQIQYHYTQSMKTIEQFYC